MPVCRYAPSGLSQADDVAVEVFVACGDTPGLLARRVDDLDAVLHGDGVLGVDVGASQADLRQAGRLAGRLRLVEREVQKGAVGPADGSVDAADPAIAGHVVVFARCKV